MKMASLPPILAALLLSAVISLPFLPGIDRERNQFALVLRMQVSTTGQSQLFYDNGAGYRETASVRLPVGYSSESTEYRFQIPPGTYRSLRFDPLVGEGSIRIESARVLDPSGEVVRDIPVDSLHPNDHFQSATVDSAGLTAVVRPGANDPQLIVQFSPFLKLTVPWLKPGGGPIWTPVFVFAGVMLLLFLFRRVAFFRRVVGHAAVWAQTRPGAAVFLISAIAVIGSCYPVVFFGKSFVSPNFSDGSVLLYGRFPTLPGYDEATVENAMGADVGAMAWHHLPLSIVEHRALTEDHELPLWNRYNATGSPLLGQGQSMFGDPLHFVAIAAKGASWAWDLKYLVAKWLFCAGLALSVLHTTRFLPGALITGISAAFIGFFVYRVNHPAFFSLCYAPWILYAWLRIRSAPESRASVPWIAGLMLANWMVMNSGTVKEAYMLLVMMNLTGGAVFLTSDRPWKTKRTQLAWLTGAGITFVLLAAPVWITFLDTLASSSTAYDVPGAHQIPPSLLLGLFDEIFYRPIQTNDRVFNPSVNFLALIGVLYVVATFRRARPDRLKTVLTIAAVPSLVLAFGFVPPEWIVEIPFLRNVIHIDNTFSCVLIVHLMVLAGFGYKLAAERIGTPEGRGDITVVALLLVAMIFPWVALTHTVLRAPFGPETVFRLLSNGQHLPVSNFVWVSLLLLPIAAIGALVLFRRAKTRARWTQTGTLLLVICAILLLWRHGQHLRYGFSDYVYNPGPRVHLLATSDAIERVRADQQEPGRVVGIYDNLVPGWSAVYGLETVSGPDALQNPFYRELTANLGLHLLWGWRIFVHPEQIDALKPYYDFLNIRHYLDSPNGGHRKFESLKPVAQLDLDVFVSETAWPRAFFTDRIVSYSDVHGLADLIRTSDGRAFAAVDRSQEALTVQFGGDLQERTVVPADHYLLTNNSTAFEVTAPSPGVAVLHEAWLPHDFRVFLNGEPAEYIRINHAFKGVILSRAGTYHITFRYEPRRFKLALAMAGIGLVLVTGAAIVTLRNRVRAS